MKKLLIISFLLFAGTAKSQWFPQFSDEHQYYNTIFFIDSLNGWVGGYSGNSFILKTTNGGENWNPSLINSSPSSIYFINNSTGYCAAFDGIYKSTDDGSSWNINYQDSLHYNSIQFFDENIGWAAGDNLSDSYLLKTENGGLTWNKYFVASGITEPRIEMINEQTGFIISLDENNIRKTTDGGKNWFVANNDPYDHQLWDISFADENNGFVCGINIFLYTSDGGNSWNKKFIPITFCTNI